MIYSALRLIGKQLPTFPFQVGLELYLAPERLEASLLPSMPSCPLCQIEQEHSGTTIIIFKPPPRHVITKQENLDYFLCLDIVPDHSQNFMVQGQSDDLLSCLLTNRQTPMKIIPP